MSKSMMVHDHAHVFFLSEVACTIFFQPPTKAVNLDCKKLGRKDLYPNKPLANLKGLLKFSSFPGSLHFFLGYISAVGQSRFALTTATS